jgi:cyclopropane fatty-acyl-phospholipid synthase-like methyltransferase
MGDNWLPMPRYKLRKDLVRRILKQENLKNKTCLEFGYGAGDMLLLFAKLGFSAYGFDISEQALEYAEARAAKHPALKERIHFHREEAQILEKRYDYIMAFEVLEHIENDASCLKDWWNLLGEDGRLLISVPAHASKWGASDIAAGHYRRYEKVEMSRLLANSGFRVLYFWNYAWPISMILDIFLHKKYHVEPSQQLSKEELSKQSGIKRQKNLVNRLASSDLFLAPFIFVQRYFLEKDLSSAYLIFAKKCTKPKD